MVVIIAKMYHQLRKNYLNQYLQTRSNVESYFIMVSSVRVTHLLITAVHRMPLLDARRKKIGFLPVD